MVWKSAAFRLAGMGLAETLMFFFFLRRQKCEEDRGWLAVSVLFLGMIYIPLQLKIIHPIADLLLRLVVGILIVHYLYHIPWRRSLFLCMVFYLIIGVAKSLLSRPILLGFGFDLAAYTEKGALHQWELSLATVALELFAVWFSSRTIFVEKEEDTPMLQLLLAMSACATYIITRQVLRSYSAVNESLGGWEITAAMFALCIASLLITLFSEYYFISDKRKGQIQKLEQMLHMQYANVRNQQKAEESVREMYHDIKNHLDCIRNVSADTQVDAYVDDIYREISRYEHFFRTGNSALDIILHEKTLTAQRNGIRLQVYTSFETMDFMDYMDICAIYANALDNAIEAVEKISEKEQRVIQLKIQTLSGCLVSKIINPYVGELQQENGRLITGKGDRELHGLGLASIRHSLEKYEGELEIQVEDGIFQLTFLIPVVPNAKSQQPDA